MTTVWDLIGKVFIGVTTAGILALVSLAWSGSKELSEIREDLASIRTYQTVSDRLVSTQIERMAGDVAELRARVRALETTERAER